MHILNQPTDKLNNLIQSNYEKLIDNSIAKSTKTNYIQAQRQWRAMLHKLSLPDEMSPTNITKYISIRLQTKVKWETVYNELSGISHDYIVRNKPIALTRDSNPLLPKLAKGFSRLIGSSITLRAAYSIDHLIQLCKNIDQTTFNGVTHTAALTIAYFGMLRAMEYCYKSNKEKHKLLRNKHITIHPSKKIIELTIPSPKTDQTGTQTVLCSCQCHQSPLICPYHNMIKYINMKHKYAPPAYKYDNSFFFITINKAKIRSLHYDDWCSEWKRFANWVGIDPAASSPHCARISGASWLFLMGVSPIIIRKLGRWRSECWTRYIRISQQHSLFIVDELVKQKQKQTPKPLQSADAFRLFNQHCFNLSAPIAKHSPILFRR